MALTLQELSDAMQEICKDNADEDWYDTVQSAPAIQNDGATTFRQVISIISKQKPVSIASMLAATMHSWQTFARRQFAKGGGKLFAYTAKQDREALSVGPVWLAARDPFKRTTSK